MVSDLGPTEPPIIYFRISDTYFGEKAIVILEVYDSKPDSNYFRNNIIKGIISGLPQSTISQAGQWEKGNLIVKSYEFGKWNIIINTTDIKNINETRIEVIALVFFNNSKIPESTAKWIFNIYRLPFNIEIQAYNLSELECKQRKLFEIIFKIVCDNEILLVKCATENEFNGGNCSFEKTLLNCDDYNSECAFVSLLLCNFEDGPKYSINSKIFYKTLDSLPPKLMNSEINFSIEENNQSVICGLLRQVTLYNQLYNQVKIFFKVQPIN